MLNVLRGGAIGCLFTAFLVFLLGLPTTHVFFWIAFSAAMSIAALNLKE